MEKKNTHSEFVGIEQLVKKHSLQLQLFEEWAKKSDWGEFHQAHYDWWMFPIDKPSSLGFAYTIYDAEVKELLSNSKFMKNYIRGVQLLLLSWGWDLGKQSPISQPEKDQHWQEWPIRLYKCVQSLKLFGKEKELQSALKFGKKLIQEGHDFTFRGKDLRSLFIDN